MPIKKTQEEFVKEAIETHRYKYNYIKSEYKGIYTKVIITCKEHGDFLQTPKDHLRGMGCKKCGIIVRSNKKRHTTEEFIKKAEKVHNNKYDYSKSEYVTISEKIIINCKIHSEFRQTPDNHLQGKGCPKCNSDRNLSNPTGWSHTNWQKAAERSKNFDGYKVYILECIDKETGEHFFKIGKTFLTLKKRFGSKFLMPYEYKIHKTYYINNAKKCSEFEQALKNKNKEFKYLPKKSFNGRFECFLKIK